VEDFERELKNQGIPLFLTPIRYDVVIYQVLYTSTHPSLGEVQASGLLFMPSGARYETFPVVGYHHGTQFRKKRKVPSGEDFLAAAMCTDGYVVVKPDYIGLGEGEGLHPYHHWVSEALSTVHMLRVLKDEMTPRLDLSLNWDMLFLTGYSQGGHATLAAHKYIQDSCQGEFTVRASSPMSGAYDLTGVQEEVMFQPYSHPAYLPYLFYGMNQFAGLFENSEDVFKQPYADILDAYFIDEQQDGIHLNDTLPEVPATMIVDSTLQAYKNDPNHPFRRVLEENS